MFRAPFVRTFVRFMLLAYHVPFQVSTQISKNHCIAAVRDI
nr:MAG TPA: hypothetical protein [Caudoviricetes sp.]